MQGEIFPERGTATVSDELRRGKAYHDAGEWLSRGRGSDSAESVAPAVFGWSAMTVSLEVRRMGGARVFGSPPWRKPRWAR